MAGPRLDAVRRGIGGSWPDRLAALAALAALTAFAALAALAVLAAFAAFAAITELATGLARLTRRPGAAAKLARR